MKTCRHLTLQQSARGAASARAHSQGSPDLAHLSELPSGSRGRLRLLPLLCDPAEALLPFMQAGAAARLRRMPLLRVQAGSGNPGEATVSEGREIHVPTSPDRPLFHQRDCRHRSGSQRGHLSVRELRLPGPFSPTEPSTTIVATPVRSSAVGYGSLVLLGIVLVVAGIIVAIIGVVQKKVPAQQPG